MITGISSLDTVSVYAFVSVPYAFSAFTVKVKLQAAVGVPRIVSPVRVRPAGRLPLEIVHVIGVLPVAASFWL